MFTMTVILKMILTALIGYVALNTLFRYHFAIDVAFLGFLFVMLFVMYFHLDTENLKSLLISTASVALVFGVGRIVMMVKGIECYFLFNVFKKQHDPVNKDILANAEELDMDANKICYNISTPCIVVFKDIEHDKVKKLFKKMDKSSAVKINRYTMYSYWSIVLFLVLIAALWRF